MNEVLGIISVALLCAINGLKPNRIMKEINWHLLNSCWTIEDHVKINLMSFSYPHFVLQSNIRTFKIEIRNLYNTFF